MKTPQPARLIARSARVVLAALGLVFGVPAAMASAADVEIGQIPRVAQLVQVPSTTSITIHDSGHAQVAVVPVGSQVHPRVSITGALGTATGTVIVSYFANGTCSGTAQAATDGTLSAGVLHLTGFAQTPPQPGSYSFKAVYLGDLSYFASNACLGFTVTKATATVGLAIHNASHSSATAISTGTTVHPRLDVTGAAGTPGGTVTVRYYANATCSSTPTSTSSATNLSSGIADMTAFAKTPTPGSYSFRASYSGNATYLARDSACRALQVNKATPTVSLAIHDAAHGVLGGSIFVNTTVHPRAAVSGALATPTGTVVASYWDDANCTAGASAASAATPLSSGVIDLTNFAQTLPAGSYSFRAAYSGDATYAPAQSPCTALTVNKYTPTVSPRVHDAGHVSVTTIVIGSTVHPQVTVTGTAGTPTGSVNFSFYPNGTCSSTATSTSLDYVLSGGSHDGTGYAQTLATAQDYSFRARYLGSATYAAASVCRKITVVKAVPQTGIVIHDASHELALSVVVTTSVHARVELYSFGGPGGLGTPTGTVTMRFYSGGTCATELSASSATALSAGVIEFTSFAQAPSRAGSYSFRGTYSGDAKYAARTTGCVVLTVTKAPSSVKLAIHDAGHSVVTIVDMGTSVHPLIQVTGNVGPASGEVTAKFWANGTCAGTPAATSSPGALQHTSGDMTAFAQTPLPSSASFRVSYPGDSRYLASTSTCVALTVRKATASITLIAHDAGHLAISGNTVPAGTTVHARMIVKGTFGTPTGTVTIALYAHGTCSSSISAPIAEMTVESGPGVEAVFVVPPGAGFHIFYGTYSGDGIYKATGPNVGGEVCDLFKVASPTPPPATAAPSGPPGPTATASGPTQSPAPVPTVTGTATLPPGVSPAPTAVPQDSLAPVATPGASDAAPPSSLATAPPVAPSGPVSSGGGPGSVGTAGPASTAGPGPGAGGAAPDSSGIVLALLGLLVIIVIGGVWIAARGRRPRAARE